MTDVVKECGGAVVKRIGDELFVGSFGGDRLLRVQLD